MLSGLSQDYLEEPDMVTHTRNLSTQEAEERGSWVQDQPGLHSEILSQKKKKKSFGKVGNESLNGLDKSCLSLGLLQPGTQMGSPISFATWNFELKQWDAPMKDTQTLNPFPWPSAKAGAHSSWGSQSEIYLAVRHMPLKNPFAVFKTFYLTLNHWNVLDSLTIHRPTE
jgi:hypothetical protein